MCLAVSEFCRTDPLLPASYFPRGEQDRIIQNKYQTVVPVGDEGESVQENLYINFVSLFLTL